LAAYIVHTSRTPHLALLPHAPPAPITTPTAAAAACHVATHAPPLPSYAFTLQVGTATFYAVPCYTRVDVRCAYTASYTPRHTYHTAHATHATPTGHPSCRATPCTCYLPSHIAERFTVVFWAPWHTLQYIGISHYRILAHCPFVAFYTRRLHALVLAPLPHTRILATPHLRCHTAALPRGSSLPHATPTATASFTAGAAWRSCSPFRRYRAPRDIYHLATHTLHLGAAFPPAPTWAAFHPSPPLCCRPTFHYRAARILRLPAAHPLLAFTAHTGNALTLYHHHAGRGFTGRTQRRAPFRDITYLVARWAGRVRFPRALHAACHRRTSRVGGMPAPFSAGCLPENFLARLYCKQRSARLGSADNFTRLPRPHPPTPDQPVTARLIRAPSPCRTALSAIACC